ncbi:Hint domain-containing protein [Streptomyces noursei]
MPRFLLPPKKSLAVHTREVNAPGAPATEEHPPRMAHPLGTATLASAAMITRDRIRPVTQSADWMNEAWELYDVVPELRFGIGWIANAASRARLYIGRIDPEGAAPPTAVQAEDDERIMEPYYELFGGQIGQGEMLRRIATHLNLVGETYICGYDHPQEHERIWQVVNSYEVSTAPGGTMQILPPDSSEPVEIKTDDAVLIRIWRPHPRRSWNADSPVISLRGACKELLDLSAHISASAESRLAGAGLLFLPDELTFPHPEQAENINPIHADPFTASLIETMMTPIRDRGSASAVVPLVVRGPAEAGGGIKHFSFSTPLDASASSLRDAATKRIASGLDIPAEILLGVADINHWCVPESTEILTRSGWKKHHDLADGEEVMTLDHEAGLPQWQPVEEVNTWDVVDEPMVQIRGEGHSSLTTLAHRWPVRSRHGVPMWTTSGELADAELGYLSILTETEETVRELSLSGRGRFTPRPRDVERTSYTGRIWCPTTPNRTWLARHEGTVFFTGNSVWALEESSIKIHIEPLLALVCDALTHQYLRPSLEALGVPDVEELALWYDVSDLVQQANRPQHALQAYQQGAISERTLRTILGFGEEDAPTKEERNRHVLTQISSTQGLLAPLLLPLLGIDTPELTEYAQNQVEAGRIAIRTQKVAEDNFDEKNASSAAGGAASGAGGGKAQAKNGPQPGSGRQGRPQPKSKGAPTRSAPGAAAAMEKALEMAVYRALDRAGGWLLSRQPRSARGQFKDVEPYELHTRIAPNQEQTELMLAGAYRDLHLAFPGAQCTHALVDGYVRDLIQAGLRHEPGLLRERMASAPCVEWEAEAA